MMGGVCRGKRIRVPSGQSTREQKNLLFLFQSHNHHSIAITVTLYTAYSNSEQYVIIQQIVEGICCNGLRAY